MYRFYLILICFAVNELNSMNKSNQQKQYEAQKQKDQAYWQKSLAYSLARSRNQTIRKDNGLKMTWYSCNSCGKRTTAPIACNCKSTTKKK